MLKRSLLAFIFTSSFITLSSYAYLGFVGDALYFVSTTVRAITRRTPLLKWVHIHLCPNCIQAKKDLLLAVQSGDMQLLEKSLAHNVDVNTTDGHNNTALHLALQQGNIEIIKRLLSHKKDIDSQNTIVKYLRYYSADQCIDLSKENSNGNTVLHEATKQDIAEIVELFIANNEDINIRNKAGYTPLMLAAQTDNTQLAELFVAAHAIETTTTLKENNNLIHVAVEAQSVHCLELLAEKYPHLVNGKNKQGDTPLTQSLRLENYHPFCKTLIENGASIDPKTIAFALEKNDAVLLQTIVDHKGPIHTEHLFYAIDKNQEKLARIICTAGIDINTYNSQGNTPLLEALKKENCIQLSTILIEHGADVNKNSIHNHVSPASLILKTGNRNFLRYAITKGLIVNSYNIVAAINNKDLESLDILLSADNSNINTYDNKNGYTPLLYAVYHNGDSDTVQLLLEYGADPTAVSTCKEATTALHFAINAHNNPVAKLLIENSAPLEQKNANGRTPLLSAARSNNAEIIECLLEHGACSDVRDNQGNPILFYAIANKNSYLLKQFCSQDCLHAINKNKESAIHTAAKHRWLEGFMHLQQIGSFDLNAQDVNGWNAATHAVNNGDIHLLTYLRYQQCCLSLKTKKGNSLLHIATNNQNPEIATYILKYHPELVSHKNKEGQSPLYVAIKNAAHITMVQQLLRHSADPNETDARGNSLLLMATQNKNDSQIEELCKHGANATIKYGPEKNTVLHIAAQNKDAKSAQTICKYTSLIDSVNAGGQTPLHLAVQKKDKIITELLLRQNANINAQDNQGNTALIIATQDDDIGMIAYLLEKNASIDYCNVNQLSAMHIAIDRNNVTGLQLFLPHIKNPSVSIDLYSDIMQYAIERNKSDATLTLLHHVRTKHLPHNFLQRFEQRCLQHAVKQNNIGIIHTLLSNNVDPHYVDQDGDTILHWAAQYADSTTMQYLIEHNVGTQAIANHDAMTPWHVALIHKRKDIIELCIAKEMIRLSDAQEMLSYCLKKRIPSIARVLETHITDINEQINAINLLQGYITAKEDSNRALSEQNITLYNQLQSLIRECNITTKIPIEHPQQYQPIATNKTYHSLRLGNVTSFDRNNIIKDLEKVQTAQEKKAENLRNQSSYYQKKYSDIQHTIYAQTHSTTAHESGTANNVQEQAIDSACLICFEENNTQKLPCTTCGQRSESKIHKACWDSWAQEHGACPNCRAEL